MNDLGNGGQLGGRLSLSRAKRLELSLSLLGLVAKSKAYWSRAIFRVGGIKVVCYSRSRFVAEALVGARKRSQEQLVLAALRGRANKYKSKL